jgi:hypothetical protein
MLIVPSSGIVPPLAPLVGRRSAEPLSPRIQHRAQRLFHRPRTSAPRWSALEPGVFVKYINEQARTGPGDRCRQRPTQSGEASARYTRSSINTTCRGGISARTCTKTIYGMYIPGTG